MDSYAAIALACSPLRRPSTSEPYRLPAWLGSQLVRPCRTRHIRPDTFWGLSETAWTGITPLLTAGLLVVAIVAAIYAARQWDSARKQVAAIRAAELEARRLSVELGRLW